MVTDCKLYECDICGRKETVEEGYEPNDIVPFEVYSLKPCICKRCLRLAMEACNMEMTVTEFADKCKECGAKYGKLLKQKEE